MITFDHCLTELGVNKSKAVEAEATASTGDSASGVTVTATAAPPAARGWYYNQDLDHYSHCDSESRYQTLCQHLGGSVTTLYFTKNGNCDQNSINNI